jgi:hypothetical protein
MPLSVDDNNVLTIGEQNTLLCELFEWFGALDLRHLVNEPNDYVQGLLDDRVKFLQLIGNSQGFDDEFISEVVAKEV